MIHAMFIIKDGVCLFSRQYIKKSIKSHLFSGFLSALMHFAKEVSHKDLKKLIIEDDIFSLYLVDNICFVFKHDEMKKSKLEKISREISDKFFSLFNTDLKNWNGEVSCFHKFDDDADKILEMKGGSALIEMEKFLQEKKIKRLKEKEEKAAKGKLALIEMERFIRGKKRDSKKD